LYVNVDQNVCYVVQMCKGGVFVALLDALTGELTLIGRILPVGVSQKKFYLLIEQV